MNCIDQVVTDRYTAIHGDCVGALRGLPDHCIGYSIFSPPFASLYTYSNSPRDMGNVRDDAEFFEHFDYLITVRAPGESERVRHTADEYPVDLWQKVASPIWMDINPSDTLQFRSAREHDDERHICPLQLEVIRRGVMLWTNPGDIVLSPFMGIGSEGYVSLELGRRFVGVELKHSYYRQAASNLASVAKPATADLFSTEAA